MAQWDLDGRVVLVTGAARGIGAESARQLAARGARVALVGLEPAELERVAGECPGAVFFEADVTDRDALAAGMSAYAASKAGVEAFSNALRTELRPLGVDVGVAYFNWIDTDMVRGTDANPLGARMRGRLKGPVGRTSPVGDAAAALVDG